MSDEKLREWFDRLSETERQQYEDGEAEIWQVNDEFVFVLLGTLHLEE